MLKGENAQLKKMIRRQAMVEDQEQKIKMRTKLIQQEGMQSKTRIEDREIGHPSVRPEAKVLREHSISVTPSENVTAREAFKHEPVVSTISKFGSNNLPATIKGKKEPQKSGAVDRSSGPGHNTRSQGQKVEEGNCHIRKQDNVRNSVPASPTSELAAGTINESSVV